MIKKLAKTLIYFILFIFALIFFAPKENLYFYLEKELKKHNIILSDEKIQEEPFGLDIKDAKLFYTKTYLARFNNINMSILIFDNTLKIDKIYIDDSIKSFIPISFEDIKINYNILDPLNINIQAKTIVGEVLGKIDLMELKAILQLKNSAKVSNKYRNILSRYKTKQGDYKYEYKF